MAIGYTRQAAADIVTGLIIEAPDFNAEFNKLQDAFDATLGHTHDGTTGGGAPINLVNSVNTATKLRLNTGGTGADLSAVPAGSSLTVSSSGVTGAIGYIQNNLVATTDPGVSNDSSQGYTFLSTWINTTGAKVWVCVSPAVSAAVWVQVVDTVNLAALINKVRVDSADTTPDYLKNKVQFSTLNSSAILNVAGNEVIDVHTAVYTAAGTDTYTITASPALTSYANNPAFFVIFTNGNLTTAPTLNVNGLGAKNITKAGTALLSAGDISPGALALVAYDGTQFQMLTIQRTTMSGVASGTNTYAIALSPAPTAYFQGMRVLVNFTNSNTNTATINVNGLGAKAITKHGTIPLSPGDIPAGLEREIIYDGTQFQIIIGSIPPNPWTAIGTGGSWACSQTLTGY